MAEPKEPREPRIPKESPPFDADNKWTRTWIMYFESLFSLSVKEAVRQTLEVAVTHSGELTKDLPVFGADAAVIKVGTKSGNTNKVVTNTGTNVTGNTVKWDASGNLIDAGVTPGGGGGGGTGTVTSVALTVPSEFSVAGSPVTTSGTLAVTKATQSANTVYAGPTTGSAAAPTFRAVVPADLPLASSSAFGAVKVDGTTITASGGVISSAGGGGSGSLVLLEQHTASGSASTLTFNAWYSSSYDEYVIKLICVVPATDGADIRLRYSSDGGSTYDATSVYDWIYVQGWINSGASGGQSALAYLTIGGNISNNATRSGVCGNITLFNPGAASYHFADYSIQYPHTSLNALASKGTVWHKNAISINAFQFFTSSGNIASGTVRVYGIVK